MAKLQLITLVCIKSAIDEFQMVWCKKDNFYYTYIVDDWQKAQQINIRTNYINLYDDYHTKFMDTKHYIGYFDSKYFITLAEYRDGRINEILND